MMYNGIVAIAGTGMVGGTLQRFLEEVRGITPVLYDPPKGLSDTTVLNTANIVFVCVPTPFDDVRSVCDTTLVEDVLSVLGDEKTVVIKSTVSPGTTERLQKQYPKKRILFNPEFLSEATADVDMRHPNRQIIGCTEQSLKSAQIIMDLLPRAPFERIVAATEAEMVKYMCNSFYALKVAYVNQIYDLCQKMGISYDQIKECVRTEPMMGTNHFEVIHKGYRGYGGKCLPKDVRGLIALAKAYEVDMSLLVDAEKYNAILQKNNTN